MPARATSTTLKAGDGRTKEIARKGGLARKAIRSIQLTDAEKIVADLVALTPAAMVVLGTAIEQGDRKIAAYVVDRAAPLERLANIAAREQIDALRIAVEERDAQIDALEAALNEALATIEDLQAHRASAA